MQLMVEMIRLIILIFSLIILGILLRLWVNRGRIRGVSPAAPWGWLGTACLVWVTSAFQVSRFGKPPLWYALPFTLVGQLLIAIYLRNVFKNSFHLDQSHYKKNPWKDEG